MFLSFLILPSVAVHLSTARPILVILLAFNYLLMPKPTWPPEARKSSRRYNAQQCFSHMRGFPAATAALPSSGPSSATIPKLLLFSDLAALQCEDKLIHTQFLQAF
jgi:hypothetical protein